MRTFGETTSFDSARDQSLFTLEALDAHADKQVRDLAKPLAQHLATGDKVEENRRAANRAAVRANARVRMRDGEADDAAREFSKDVLAAVRQDRTAPLFRLLFSHSPSDLIALSLAPELDAIDGIVATLGDHSVPADLRKKWTALWTRLLAAGRAALAERDEAARAAASSSLEVERWIARADKHRRAIDGALTQYAAENDLPADFNDRFFPAVTGSKRAKRTAPATQPGAPAQP